MNNANNIGIGTKVLYRGWQPGVVELVRESFDYSNYPKEEPAARLSARVLLDDGTTNDEWVDRLKVA